MESMTKTDVHISWMIRRDLPEVLKIEDESFKYPWDEQDFVSVLMQRNCIGMVAKFEDKIVGYMLYELHKTDLHVINFAVDYHMRRHKIGTAMVDKLKTKLSNQRRTKLIMEVADYNLGAQIFFQKQGFKAIGVLRDFYDECDADAYLMEYEICKKEN